MSGHRIDFHHHLSPPSHLEALSAARLGRGPEFDWSPEKSIAEMERAGIERALLSVSTPAVTFLDRPQAVRVSRESNEFAARLKGDWPSRFGALAVLPMPHIDESLAEIAYALDVLGAEGISLMTSYGDTWLGAPQFDPILEELHRRRAVVHVHPTCANCCVDVLPHLPRATVEFGADTTRAIANLIFGGAASRFSDAKIVFSHGGGAMPFLIERFLIVPTRGRFPSFTEDSVLAALRSLHYDTALIARPGPLAALASIVPTSQIVFGSDFPYQSAVDSVNGVTRHFSGDGLAAVERENAIRLLSPS